MKIDCVLKSNAAPDVEYASGSKVARHLPTEVIQAMALDWRAHIDAYLVNAARVGTRYAAIVFCDQSGVLSDGMTVATPPVRHVETLGAFKLLQTLDGTDHYVVVTEHDDGLAFDGNGN